MGVDHPGHAGRIMSKNRGMEGKRKGYGLNFLGIQLNCIITTSALLELRCDIWLPVR
jgi:hypothetical protein